MIAQTPDDRFFSALPIVATLPNDPPENLVGVVMRAGFTLVANGSKPRQPVPSSDQALVSLTLATINEPGAPQSDMVPEKERIDVIVKGHINGGAINSGLVRIDGQVVRKRNDPPADDPDQDIATDLDKHLFGLHSAREEGRHPGPLGSTVPAEPDYHPRVNNAYRRSAGFVAPPLTAALSPGALVEIFQNADGNGSAYRFTLPTDTFTARLRVATGHCPDQPARWAIREAMPLPADTLVVDPDTHTAHMVWRTTWSAEQYGPAQRRAIQIKRNEA